MAGITDAENRDDALPSEEELQSLQEAIAEAAPPPEALPDLPATPAAPSLVPASPLATVESAGPAFPAPPGFPQVALRPPTAPRAALNPPLPSLIPPEVPAKPASVQWAKEATGRQQPEPVQPAPQRPRAPVAAPIPLPQQRPLRPSQNFHQRLARRRAGLPLSPRPRPAVGRQAAPVPELPESPLAAPILGEGDTEGIRPFERPVYQPRPPAAPTTQPLDFRNLQSPNSNMESMGKEIIDLLKQILQKLPSAAVVG